MERDPGSATAGAIGRRERLAWWALLVVLAGATAVTRITEHDVPWLVRAGELLLRTHALPRHDPFSYTSDIPWLNHEWLAEILLAAAYRAGGFAGVSALAALAVAGTAALLLCAVPAAGLGEVAVAAALIGLRDLAQPRAEVLALPVLVGMYVLARRDLEKPGNALLAVLPLQLLLTQLHGGDPLGVAIVGLAALAGGRRGLARRLAVTAGVAALTCAGPYGWHVHDQVLEAGSALSMVHEWQPLWHAPLGAPTVATALLALLALAGALVRPSGPDAGAPAPDPARRFELAVLTVFALVALLHIRFLREAVLFAAPPAARLLAGLRAPRRLALAAAATVALVAFPATASRAGTGLDPDRFPERAVAFVERAHLRGPMLNSYNFGGYLLFADPRLPVFIDGRAFTVYSRAFLEQLVELYRRPRSFAALEDRYGFRLAFLARTPVTRRLAEYLDARPDWRLVYADAQALVFARTAREEGPTPRAPGR